MPTKMSEPWLVLQESQLEMRVTDAGLGGGHELRCPGGVCLRNIDPCMWDHVWQNKKKKGE